MNLREMLRVVPSLVVVTAFGIAAWQLARVDSPLGKPIGPDRLVAQADKVVDLVPRRVLAVDILRDRPVDGSAFRVLGKGAESAGNIPAAENFYRIASRRNPRDPSARRWLLEYSFAQGQVDEGVRHLDALLRASPAMGQPVLQGLAGRLGDEALRDALAARLALEPPWRTLLPAALSDTPDPSSAEALLALLATPSPPVAEVELRVALLERLGRPLQARDIWLTSLPAASRPLAGLIFDGGFENGEGPLPYGWRLHSPVGASVGVDHSNVAQGRSSLALVFDGRAVDFSGVSQDIVLPQGGYLFTLQADMGLIATTGSFAWTVRCRGSEQELARMELPARTGGWQRHSTSFRVPAACPTQQLSLVHAARSLSERQISGRIAFDGLKLQRQSQ